MKEIYIAVVIVIVLSQALQMHRCFVKYLGANHQRKLICVVSMLGLGYCYCIFTNQFPVIYVMLNCFIAVHLLYLVAHYSQCHFVFSCLFVEAVIVYHHNHVATLLLNNLLFLLTILHVLVYFTCSILLLFYRAQ